MRRGKHCLQPRDFGWLKKMMEDIVTGHGCAGRTKDDGTTYEAVLTRRQAPRPSPGPHKLRECLPLTVFLRNRLKYALTGQEVTSIVKQRAIQVDGKVRTDETYPAGFMG